MGRISVVTTRSHGSWWQLYDENIAAIYYDWYNLSEVRICAELTFGRTIKGFNVSFRDNQHTTPFSLH